MSFCYRLAESVKNESIYCSTYTCGSRPVRSFNTNQYYYAVANTADKARTNQCDVPDTSLQSRHYRFREAGITSHTQRTHADITPEYARSKHTACHLPSVSKALQELTSRFVQSKDTIQNIVRSALAIHVDARLTGNQTVNPLLGRSTSLAHAVHQTDAIIEKNLNRPIPQTLYEYAVCVLNVLSLPTIYVRQSTRDNWTTWGYKWPTFTPSRRRRKRKHGLGEINGGSARFGAEGELLPNAFSVPGTSGHGDTDGVYGEYEEDHGGNFDEDPWVEVSNRVGVGILTATILAIKNCEKHRAKARDMTVQSCALRPGMSILNTIVNDVINHLIPHYCVGASGEAQLLHMVRNMLSKATQAPQFISGTQDNQSHNMSFSYDPCALMLEAFRGIIPKEVLKMLRYTVHYWFGAPAVVNNYRKVVWETNARGFRFKKELVYKAIDIAPTLSCHDCSEYYGCKAFTLVLINSMKMGALTGITELLLYAYASMVKDAREIRSNDDSAFAVGGRSIEVALNRALMLLAHERLGGILKSPDKTILIPATLVEMMSVIVGLEPLQQYGRAPAAMGSEMASPVLTYNAAQMTAIAQVNAGMLNCASGKAMMRLAHDFFGITHNVAANNPAQKGDKAYWEVASRLGPELRCPMDGGRLAHTAGNPHGYEALISHCPEPEAQQYFENVHQRASISMIEAMSIQSIGASLTSIYATPTHNAGLVSECKGMLKEDVKLVQLHRAVAAVQDAMMPIVSDTTDETYLDSIIHFLYETTSPTQHRALSEVLGSAHARAMRILRHAQTGDGSLKDNEDGFVRAMKRFASILAPGLINV